jgi:hypothetical protein
LAFPVTRNPYQGVHSSPNWPNSDLTLSLNTHFIPLIP